MWKLLQKLRVALAEDDDAFPLRGVIEADEAYVGGKGRAGHGGRSLKDHRRSLVVCAVEREWVDLTISSRAPRLSRRSTSERWGRRGEAWTSIDSGK